MDDGENEMAFFLDSIWYERTSTSRGESRFMLDDIFTQDYRKLMINNCSYNL
jgi:hypothetical protein